MTRPSSMWVKWLDRTEAAIVVFLTGILFWPPAVANIALILGLLVAAIRRPRSLIPDRTLGWLLLPVVLLLLPFLLSGAPDQGWNELKLWVLPAGFALFLRQSPHRPLAIRSFVLVSLLQAFFLLAFLAVQGEIDPTHFSQSTRDLIGDRLGIHPTYISAFWAWAVIMVWMQKITSQVRAVSASVFLILMIALCGGKMPVIALLIVAIVLFFREYQLTLRQRLMLLIVGIALSTSLAFTPGLRDRVSELSNVDIAYSEGQMLSSTEVRVGIWRCMLHVIKENPWWGVGTGNTRQALENCYSEYQQSEFFETEFNSHQQFLHFWLAGGVLAFVAFLAWYIWTMKTALKEQKRLLFYFLLFFALIAMTENYFSRQLGMSFWSLFLALGLFPSADNKSS